MLNDEISFTCKDKGNDFPNIITYKKDKRLKASVSDGEMLINFDFEKFQ